MANESDKRFVHSSIFLTHARAVKSLGMPRELFNPRMDARIDRLVARSDVHVVYTPEFESEIMGFSVLEGRVLHAVYVKSLYRGMGIASGLVKGRADFYTLWAGNEGDRFAQRNGIVYDPFLLDK